MKTSSFLAIIGFFAVVFLPVSSATAVDIVVPDAGFDDHVLNNVGDYIYIGDSSYTGAWKNDIGPGDGAYIDYGYWRSQGDLADLPARSDDFKAYPSDAGVFDYIYQILDETFVEGATYTLSVWVGNAWAGEGYADGWWLYFTGENYKTNLIEAHGLALLGDWEQISLAYTATAADAGKRIGIKMAGEEGESYIAFEDVTLSYEVPTIAKDPTPADDAGDVPAITTLTWTPGLGATAHDVYLGEVFADVNEATRSDDRGVLVERGQNAATYDPLGDLEFSRTYYWRIDEVETGGTALHKGFVWSFTVEPLAYPVEGVTVMTNTVPSANEVPENVVDGSGLNEDDQHSTDPTNMWSGTAEAGEVAYIQFDFTKVYKLHEMLVWNYNMALEKYLGVGLKDVLVEYSEGGENWVALDDVVFAQGSGLNTYTANTTVAFDGVAVKAVRFTINSTYGTSGLVGLSEVRFMHIPTYAREPEPADEAVDVAVDAVLNWRPGRAAVSHDVYLGPDPNALPLADTTTDAGYNPGVLNLDSTYYWQIDENDGTATWRGDLWSFVTQEYIVVDDFEAYDDDIDAGTTIWQNWIDGLEDPTHGGAVVGKAASPFAEQTIVRTGKQSLNFFYDNPNASAISEADLTLVPAQDWTASGIKTLSLWFHGAAGNTGQLYVKINGVEVPYDGAAGDIAVAVWQPWNIDLTTVGGNLSSVSTLTVGVKGAGEGVVYFDDIRLYANAPEVVDSLAYGFHDLPDGGGACDGIHGGIDFGSGNWWGGDNWYGMTKCGYFSDDFADVPMSFTLPENAHLVSIALSAETAYGYTISDGVNVDIVGTTGTAPEVVNTNWTSGGSTITITTAGGWEVVFDDITYTTSD